MKRAVRWVGALFVGVICTAANAQPGVLCEPWAQPYAGDDATGEHVIAYWPFDAGSEATDASGSSAGMSGPRSP